MRNRMFQVIAMELGKVFRVCCKQDTQGFIKCIEREQSK